MENQKPTKKGPTHTDIMALFLILGGLFALMTSVSPPTFTMPSNVLFFAIYASVMTFIIGIAYVYLEKEYRGQQLFGAILFVFSLLLVSWYLLTAIIIGTCGVAVLVQSFNTKRKYQV